MPEDLRPPDPSNLFGENGPSLRLLLRIVKSPRDLARWSNALRMLLLADDDIDVHPSDAAIIAAVEVFHPDFYLRLRSNRSLLTGDRSSIDDFLLSSKNRAERTTRRLRDLLGDVDSLNHTLYTDIVETLFGKIVESNRIDDPLELARRNAIPSSERRIRSSIFFDRYFGYSTEVGALSYRSVLRLISKIEDAAENQASEQRLATLFFELFTSLEPESRERLLLDLQIQFVKLNASVLEKVGRAALRLPSDLSPDVPFRLFTAVLARICGPGDRVWYGTQEAATVSATLIQAALEELSSHLQRWFLLSPRADLVHCMREEDRQRLTLAWLTRLDEDLGAGLELQGRYDPQTSAHVLAAALEVIFELRYRKVVFRGANLVPLLREYIREYPERFVTAVQHAAGPWGLGVLNPGSAPKVLDLIDSVLEAPGFAELLLKITTGAPDISDEQGVLHKLKAALEERSGDTGESNPL